MRSARIANYGSVEVIYIEDVTVPAPSGDEVLVSVVASTINPVDVKTRSSDAPQEVSSFPATLGWDLAGVVIRAPESSVWEAGDHVVAMNPPGPAGGSWAEIVALPPDRLVKAPRSVDLVTAATLPLAGLTAQQALARLKLTSGDQVLVTGAAGSVGGMAVQLASVAGHRVTGLVSRSTHIREAEGLGAGRASADLESLGEFDAIFDTAGVFYRPSLLRPGGRIVTVSDDPIPDAFKERASLAMTSYVQHDLSGLEKLVALVDSGALKLRVDQIFPLERVREAHVRFEQGGRLGKTVISF